MGPGAPPLVLLVGDSISIGYAPHARAALAGRAEVRRHEGNAGDSFNALSNLGAWLGGIAPRVVHVNVGLHDLRVWSHTGRHQVPVELYGKNVTLLLERLRATGAAVVWATTTPVLDGAPRASAAFRRRNADVEAYNAAALSAARAAGVAVNDLNAFVRARGVERSISPDGAHMTEETYAALGAEVARAIRERLP